MEIEFGIADHNGVEVASPYGRTQLVDALKECDKFGSISE